LNSSKNNVGWNLSTILKTLAALGEISASPRLDAKAIAKPKRLLPLPASPVALMYESSKNLSKM
jgi:hypothetical protein